LIYLSFDFAIASSKKLETQDEEDKKGKRFLSRNELMKRG